MFCLISERRVVQLITELLVRKVSQCIATNRLYPNSDNQVGLNASMPIPFLYPKKDVSKVIAFRLFSIPPMYPLAVYLLNGDTPKRQS